MVSHNRCVVVAGTLRLGEPMMWAFFLSNSTQIIW